MSSESSSDLYLKRKNEKTVASSTRWENGTWVVGKKLAVSQILQWDVWKINYNFIIMFAAHLQH